MREDRNTVCANAMSVFTAYDQVESVDDLYFTVLFDRRSVFHEMIEDLYVMLEAMMPESVGLWGGFANVVKLYSELSLQPPDGVQELTV